ncbi:hypothetical protein JZ751_017105 [Albula glossodonta]|uniref:FXYD domain-containing ion transport regulator n=1 Tax=Albula glossodonta TaxID=121402 RepID=A0A8T2P0G2_9TELE|nr:hypothetical protein JZ751_017105 [Albula glossodonta]
MAQKQGWVWVAEREPAPSPNTTPPHPPRTKRTNASADRQETTEDPFGCAAPEIDPDADFVYDYHTLRVGGLTFAGGTPSVGAGSLSLVLKMKRNENMNTEPAVEGVGLAEGGGGENLSLEQTWSHDC